MAQVSQRTKSSPRICQHHHRIHDLLLPLFFDMLALPVRPKFLFSPFILGAERLDLGRIIRQLCCLGIMQKDILFNILLLPSRPFYIAEKGYTDLPIVIFRRIRSAGSSRLRVFSHLSLVLRSLDGSSQVQVGSTGGLCVWLLTLGRRRRGHFLSGQCSTWFHACMGFYERDICNGWKLCNFGREYASIYIRSIYQS